MKLISWNIDGLNAALENKESSSERSKMSYKTVQDIAALDPYVFAIQETKLSELKSNHIEELTKLFPNHKIAHTMSTKKKGYSGTMTLYKGDPKVTYPTINPKGAKDLDTQGRITTLEYPNYYIVNVYTPNSSKKLVNLPNRMKWDLAFNKYIETLIQEKGVLICGDLNVAHTEIDLKNPKGNKMNAGFSDEERQGMTNLLDLGLMDSLRVVKGDEPGIYSWFTQLSKTAKANNSGWRIDYWLVDNQYEHNIKDAGVIDTGERKDHSPVFIDIII